MKCDRFLEKAFATPVERGQVNLRGDSSKEKCIRRRGVVFYRAYFQNDLSLLTSVCPCIRVCTCEHVCAAMSASIVFPISLRSAARHSWPVRSSHRGIPSRGAIGQTNENRRLGVSQTDPSTRETHHSWNHINAICSSHGPFGNSCYYRVNIRFRFAFIPPGDTILRDSGGSLDLVFFSFFLSRRTLDSRPYTEDDSTLVSFFL